MALYYETTIGKYVDADTGQVAANQNPDTWSYTAADAKTGNTVNTAKKTGNSRKSTTAAASSGSAASDTLTQGQIAEQSMSAADQAALKAAGDKYNAATTDAERQAAHTEAEAIRAKYGYSGGTNGAGYIATPKAGSTGGSAGSTPTIVSRNGQAIQAYILNGQTVDANGNPFQFQNGDLVKTNGGNYYWNNGKAVTVDQLSDSQLYALLRQFENASNYVTSTGADELAASQAFENWLKENNGGTWTDYLRNGVNWNVANLAGDEYEKNLYHTNEENLRGNYGFKGGDDGTKIQITDPSQVPEELVSLFQPYIDRYNQSLIEAGSAPVSTNSFMSMLLNGYPDYNAPELTASPDTQITMAKLAGFPEFVAAQIASAPNGEITLATLGKYPEFVRAIVQNAPESNLTFTLNATYPEYTVGQGVEDMQGLNYDPQYMKEYWNKFQTEYDPNRFESDYDEIRDQLIAANQAGVDLGRQQLQAQLENALPQYDELRRQNDLAKAKAANNMALYNTAQGDLGGIGSRAYSLEQNAYDQRMNEIQLEQQNLINTTNQQIAQLEAEGKMQEAQILAEWAQQKLAMMQEQYNQYWNLYQQGAANMENLMYGIASDEWNRDWQIRADKLQQELNAYNAGVDKYNAEFNLAKTLTDIQNQNWQNNLAALSENNANALSLAKSENDYLLNRRADELERQARQLEADKYNSSYNYDKWLQESNFANDLAKQRNDYNATAANYGLDAAKLKASIDEGNAERALDAWYKNNALNLQASEDLNDWNLNKYKIGQQLVQDTIDRAWEKLNAGFNLTDTDLTALGLTKDQASTYAKYINDMKDIDLQSAQTELEILGLQAANYLSGGSKSSGRGSGSGGGGGDKSLGTGGTILDRLFAAGVTPQRAYETLLDMGYSRTEASDLEERYYGIYDELKQEAMIAQIRDQYGDVDKAAVGDAIVGTILSNLGLKGSNSSAADILSWGLNHDKGMQNILNAKGIPYAEPTINVGSKTSNTGTNIGSANYKGKK